MIRSRLRHRPARGGNGGEVAPSPPANILFDIQSAAVGSNTGGTDDFTKTSFGTPKGVMNALWYTNGVDDIEQSSGLNIGFADGTREGQITGFSKHGLATPDSDQYGNNANAIEIITHTGSGTIADASMSNITDGCRYTWGASGAPVDYGLGNLMFGGSALSAYAGSRTLSMVDNGTVGVTGVGFKPDVVLLACTERNFSTFKGTHLVTSFGFCDAALHQGSAWYRDFGLLADSFIDVEISNSHIANFRQSTDDENLQIISMDSDGFSVHAMTGGGSWLPDIVFLAIKLAASTDAKVGTFDLPDGVEETHVTGIGFKPRLVIQALVSSATYDRRHTNPTQFFGLSVFTAGQAFGGGSTQCYNVDGVQQHEGNTRLHREPAEWVRVHRRGVLGVHKRRLQSRLHNRPFWQRQGDLLSFQVINMAGIYDRIDSLGVDRLSANLLHASYILRALGEFTDPQILNGLNSTLVAPLAGLEVTDLQNIAAAMDGETGSTAKMIYAHRLRATLVAVENQVINESQFRSILGIA